MSKQLKLKIITPERLVFEEMVDQVSIPTTEGEITVLPNHIPIISGLLSGDIVGVINGELVPIAVVGGFVEVKQNEGITEVAILADFAEHVATLTDDKIEKAKSRAEELKLQMQNKPARNATQSVAGGENVDFEHFESELERAITSVRISDKWRTRKYRK